MTIRQYLLGTFSSAISLTIQNIQILTQITEMENLEALTNLESLDISFNRLRKIQGLENLVKLRYGYGLKDVCHVSCELNPCLSS